MSRFALALTVLAVSFSSALAQAPPAKEEAKTATKVPAKKKESPYAKLPKPFDEIKFEFEKLEEDGLFKVVDVKFDFIADSQDQGVSWTLEVQRRATCRRATSLLKNLREVRFSHLSKDTRSKLPIYKTVLEYPGILDQAAAQGKTLLRTERFRVWIPLTDVEARRLIGRDANLVQMGRLKRPPK